MWHFCQSIRVPVQTMEMFLNIAFVGNIEITKTKDKDARKFPSLTFSTLSESAALM